MVSLKATPFYNEVLKEINYSFGDIFIFEKFIVSEIKVGFHISWEKHTKLILKDVMDFLDGDVGNLIYISHRINSYSVAAMDWLKFYESKFNLKGHAIVAYNKATTLNIEVENIFFKKKIKQFDDLESAIVWAKHSELLDNK